MPALLLRFLPHLLAVAGLIAIGLWLRHSGHAAGEAEVQAKWDKQRADQTVAAFNTVLSAVERDARERKVREQEAAARGEELLQTAAKIAARVNGISRTINEARQHDPECANWFAQPVRCPVGWVRDGAGDSDGGGARASELHPGAGLLPAADPAERPAADDEWRPAPVSGLISRPD